VAGSCCSATRTVRRFKVEYFGNTEASAKKCADAGSAWATGASVRTRNGWLFFRIRKGGGIRHNGDFVNVAYRGER